jgi:hypothetical protein
LGHLLGADVGQGTQWQGQGAPPGVPHRPGQSHPDVAVDELRARGAGAGVAVDAGALHARAVAGGGRVADGEEQVLARGQTQQRPRGTVRQAEGQGAGMTAGGLQGVVGGAEVVLDAGGPEPGGDGASAAGEQGAAKQQEQAWCGAAVEGGGDLGEPGGQGGGQVREWHGRLLGRRRGGRQPSSCSGGRLLSTRPSVSCLLPRLRLNVQMSSLMANSGKFPESTRE